MAETSAFRSLTHSSPFGDFAIVWLDTGQCPEVRRIFLPAAGLCSAIRETFPSVSVGNQPVVSALARDIDAFLRGRSVEFSLDQVSLSGCGEFQQQVLRAEHAIPRGWVSSYGGIAVHIGLPAAARAVGRALATNPFPIVVPCHRAIRADGSLGGYQGGTAMKKALLELEGVQVSPGGRVIEPRMYYLRRTPG